MNAKSKTTPDGFADKCIASCQRLIAQIKRTKDNVQTEYRELVSAHEQLLHLALNEAEALAWETPYPHLVFPTLALEKAQAVADWDAHQRFIRKNSYRLNLAA